MEGRREGRIFEGWMGRSGLCLEAIPALGGVEVTLSLSLSLSAALPLPTPATLSSLPLWHQCPTRWYWKLVPVSGAVFLPCLPAPLVAVCVSLSACLSRSLSYSPLLPVMSKGSGTQPWGTEGSPLGNQGKRVISALTSPLVYDSPPSNPEACPPEPRWGDLWGF